MPVMLIAGASGVGKTMTAQEFASQQTDPLPIVHLDGYRNLLWDQARVIPSKLSVPEIEAFTEAATKDICLRLLSDLLTGQARCMAEGTWMNPDTASELRQKFGPRFSAVYCGYPEADAQARYARLKADGLHHLLHKPEDKAIEYLEGQIESSRWFQSQARAEGFAFVDFTDIEQGRKELLSLLTDFFYG
ncbi:AAA family ATPase [Rhodovibrionaceae bacterium A322]